jgi:predicted esterase
MVDKVQRDVLVSGKTSFKVEVPYILIETGEKQLEQGKPLIVYLHGYGEHLKSFKKRCDKMLDLQAYHLFIQGPYPLFDRTRKKNVSEWGRAWYLYDGNRRQFIKSLELASEFIQEIIDKLLPMIHVRRLSLFGYSMGGYLAGYFALTRWKHVNDLIVAGARIKTEILNDQWDQISHMNILALHGKEDDQVKPGPQKVEIDRLIENGVHAELKLLNENHSFSEAYVAEAVKWLKERTYEKA